MHQPREVWVPQIVIAVLTFILGILVTYAFSALSERTSRHRANVALSRPVPFVRKFPVMIDDGTNVQIMPKPGRYVAGSSRSPFSFFITSDGSVNLRGDIRDAEGHIVAEATGDSIRVTKPDGFDINSDSKAIEVVDSGRRPRFQLIIVPYETFAAERAQRDSKLKETALAAMANRGIPGADRLLADLDKKRTEELKKMNIDEVIRLSYITHHGETWTISSCHGNEWVKVLNDYDWSKIPRLFCYPGYSHPGERTSQQK